MLSGFGEKRVKQLCYAAYAAALLVFVLSLTGPDLLYKSGTRPAPLVSSATPPSSGLQTASEPEVQEAARQKRSPSAKIVAGRTPPKIEGRYGDNEGHCHMEWTNNACPGTYEVRIRPGAATVWPFPRYQEDWRKSLGDRLLVASQGQLTDEACQGFFMWGDYVWCNHAVEPGSGAPRPPDPQREGTDVVGISFGIRERDPWSELMGNRYKMATHLYDCYWGTGNNAEQTQTKGPLGFGAAPDKSAVQNIAGQATCPPRKTMLSGCYEMPYEAHRVCLSQSTKTKRAVTGAPHDAWCRQGRPPLSTHVKIDAEGSEWVELADLVANPEDCAKIRTLDMEVHYNLGDIGVHTECDQETLTKRVETMEKLSEIFAVTGSTFRALLENEDRLSNKSGGIDGGQHCIVTSGGWHLDQYCISFTNRELVAE
ncbi:unnamed protein product [Prorocentrum cordatum]|uniref:Methyltransferase domain-containing protein n=1 Tax=Prorocentrum cordatum TaxID=2364126 RepID=A0ABN9QMK5_9DINO|nr:unnamed protein product [Polarella glacialis]